jgi:protein-disulfide isomerase
MKNLVRTLAISAAAIGLAAACGGKSSTSVADGGDMELGNPNAPVTLIEYASATCSHCARFDRDVFPTLKARYIDTGKIRYVFREFLTPPVPVAAAAFVLARCAGKEKYFQVVEAVFRSQEEMFATQDSRTPLLRIAKSMGMTEDGFNTCLSDAAALDAVQKRADRGATEDKIEGTPTFLVNGKQVASGETTMDVLAKAIDAAAASSAKK